MEPLKGSKRVRSNIFYSFVIILIMVLALIGMTVESLARTSHQETFADFKQMKSMLREIENEHKKSDLLLSNDYIEAKSLIERINRLTRSYYDSNDMGKDLIMVAIGFNVDQLEESLTSLEEIY